MKRIIEHVRCNLFVYLFIGLMIALGIMVVAAYASSQHAGFYVQCDMGKQIGMFVYSVGRGGVSVRMTDEEYQRYCGP